MTTPSLYTLPPRKPWVPVLCWIIIVASLALVFFSNYRERKAEDAGTRTAAADDPANDQTTVLRIAERNALGMHQLASQPGGDYATSAKLLASVSADAKTPLEQLRLVPMIAELKGAQAALDDLDANQSLWKSAGLASDAKIFRKLYSNGPDSLSTQQRDQLLDRHGWFAQLALTYGKPDSSPDRHAILSSVGHMSQFVIAVAGGGLIALLAGLVIGIMALTRLTSGTIYHGYTPRGGFRDPPPPPAAWMNGAPPWSAPGGYIPPPSRQEQGGYTPPLGFRQHNQPAIPNFSAVPAAPSAGPEFTTDLPANPTIFLEAFAIFIAGVALPLLVPERFLMAHRLLGALGLMFVPTALALLWPRLRGLGWDQVRRAMGWHAGRGVMREIGAGVIGSLAALPIFAIGILLTELLSKWSGETATHPLVNSAGKGTLVTVLMYAIACVWAPLVEESMFRGALFHHLRQRWHFVPTALLVALLFAALHPQGWVGIPALACLALGLATVREWRGSIIASMTMHALNNFVVVTLLIISVG